MLIRLPFVVCVLLSSLSVVGQTPENYYGKLTGLQPDASYIYQRVFSTKDPTIAKYRFDPVLPAKTEVSLGNFTDDRVAGSISALLIESPNQLPSLAIDLNSDSVITGNERFNFAVIPGGGDNYLQLNLRLPITNPLFSAFPVYVRYYRGLRHPKLELTDRLLDQTVWAFAVAKVAIDGKDVSFRYRFEPSKPTISTTNGLFGLDVDGDGLIKSEQFSIESSYAHEAEIVFRYGEKYISTASIDLAKNQVVVRRRDKSAYLREELAVGKQMADFSFVDFSGKKRNLAEFRGKYLLLEWWGVWCVDCVRDMPYTVEAYKKFRSRGFEILGLNWDDRVEDAASFLQKNSADWPQARKDSIKLLTEVTHRIQEYPAAVLLDPNGKVISLDQEGLEGPRLAKTLEALIPSSPR